MDDGGRRVDDNRSRTGDDRRQRRGRSGRQLSSFEDDYPESDETSENNQCGCTIIQVAGSKSYSPDLLSLFQQSEEGGGVK